MVKNDKQLPKPLDYKKLEECDVSQIHYFTQLPLSQLTLKGLKACGFTKPTDIQKLVIKHALLGRDVVAEAPTGCGKTLAFIVPVLEKLFLNNVSSLDGPVALILTPTRELSRQIYGVFKRCSVAHQFTILNIMGGKPTAVKTEEWNCVARANILIGTPGRLAQHQTQNPLFDACNLNFLVLDEADRLLDSTFREDLETILQNLPSDRQTMLFSATQTKAIDQLIRLSMQDPIILSTYVKTSHTPTELVQSYAIVPLDQKLDVLWTFLQSHCKKKIIVFLSTQKQVRFVYELFQQLRPYYRVLQLRGNMNQQKRFQVYDRFSSTPQGAVLLATNVAERGLDFPNVDWVVQFDCPHHVDEYIHRVGRTARFGHHGRAIIFLMPSELHFVELLRQRSLLPRLQKFPVTKIRKFVSSRAPSLLVRKLDLANAARSAVCAYLRDYCLAARQQLGSKKGRGSNDVNTPTVFDPAALPLMEFANSFGLPSLPVLPREFSQFVPHAPELVSAFSLDSFQHTQSSQNQDSVTGLSSGSQHGLDNTAKPGIQSLNGIKRLDLVEDSSTDSDTTSDLFNRIETHDSPTLIERDNSQLPLSGGRNKKPLTRIQKAKKELKRKLRTHTKIEFDESGQVTCKKIGDIPIQDAIMQHAGQLETLMPSPTECLNIDKEREFLRQVVDKEDKKLWRERVNQRHRERRRKIREARRQLQESLLPKLPDTVEL